MKVQFPLLLFVIAVACTAHAHIFYRDIMSEDNDVSYGLPSVRVKRDTWGSEGRLGGPLYTHVKTDQGGTFKWGTKHMVGRMFAGDKVFDEEHGF